MSKKDAIKLPAIVTPKAPAAYAWLNKEDEKYGGYKITVLLDKKDMGEGRLEGGNKVVPGKAWVKHILSECKKHGVVDKIGEKGCPIKDGDKSGKEDFKGFLMLTAKTGFDPHADGKVVDTKGNALPKRQTVWSGDIVKVAIQPTVRTVNGDTFMSLYISKIMLIEKSGYGDVSMGEEEGYVSAGSDDVEMGEDKEFATDDDDDEDGGGDF